MCDVSHHQEQYLANDDVIHTMLKYLFHSVLGPGDITISSQPIEDSGDNFLSSHQHVP